MRHFLLSYTIKKTKYLNPWEQVQQEGTFWRLTGDRTYQTDTSKINSDDKDTFICPTPVVLNLWENIPLRGHIPDILHIRYLHYNS